MREVDVAMTVRKNARGPALEGAVVLVLGYGRSGRAAANLLLEAGAQVRVTDGATLEKLGVAAHDVPGGDRWIGTRDSAVMDGVDVVIASPGVPPHHPQLAAALASDVPVFSELELGSWFIDAPIVAITGTNGKTTTTELLGAMGRASGRRTVVAGNVGTPLSEVAGSDADLFVVEVSSFQLFLCEHFRPDVALLLNLTPDHFDWHPDFEHYAAAKERIFRRQRKEDAAVLPAGDPPLAARFSIPSRLYEFSATGVPARGAYVRDGQVVLHLDEGQEPVFSLSEWQLPGVHNLENLLAASLAARVAGLDAEAIREGARSCRPMAHRMEHVATIDGVRYVNDSKSTNPGSLEKALDPNVPTLLIAGGVTKGCDFRPLRDAVRRGARRVFVIGEGAEDMATAWDGVTEIVRAGDLETALGLAAAEARTGERVLLSPGCASFDQFDNYVHRGNRFRELVGVREEVNRVNRSEGGRE
jgi:UDP-N-acetylmuramoylalanine--D-glutamate ligase